MRKLTSKNGQGGPVRTDPSSHLVGGGTSVLSSVRELQISDGQSKVCDWAAIVLSGGLSRDILVRAVDKPLPADLRDVWGGCDGALHCNVLTICLLVECCWQSNDRDTYNSIKYVLKLCQIPSFLRITFGIFFKIKSFNFVISLKLILINIALISLSLNNCSITLSYQCYKVNYISKCSWNDYG